MWNELATSFQNGNPYVILICVLGFPAITIIFERVLTLNWIYNLDFKNFIAQLKKMIAADDIDRAVTHCKNESKTSLPMICLKALEASETDPTTVKSTIEEETIAFIPLIEKRTSILPAFALLILLIGTLGTIDALMTAFNAVDVLDSAKKQVTLANGISASMHSTALALIFGILILAGHHLVKGMASMLLDKLHHGVTVVYNLLVPQEVATFMPVAAAEMPMTSAAAQPAAPQDLGNVAEELSAEPPASDGDGDDSFDDVSVEDIKDEEEII